MALELQRNGTGMALEWHWNGTRIAKEWPWNDPGMVMKWHWNGSRMALEWFWNDCGMAMERIGKDSGMSLELICEDISFQCSFPFGCFDCIERRIEVVVSNFNLSKGLYRVVIEQPPLRIHFDHQPKAVFFERWFHYHLYWVFSIEEPQNSKQCVDEVDGWILWCCKHFLFDSILS